MTTASHAAEPEVADSAAPSTSMEIEARYTSGSYKKQNYCFVRGKGTRVWDDRGNEYLDFAAGIGTSFLGHCHPAVVAAIKRQAETMISCTEIYYNDARAGLYAQLAAVCPDPIDRFFITNSGTEAIEGAMKWARVSTKRTDFVAFDHSFHGRTMGSLSATGKAAIRDKFGPMVPGFTHVDPDDVAAIEAAVTDKTAAIIFEPVQGEGGVIPIRRETAECLKRMQAERGVLLIADEIQTGFCRTGYWFACEHFGIRPDLLAIAKAMGAGFPIGAIGIAKHLGTMPATMHGSTYGGTPLACAAATAAIQTMRDERLWEVAGKRGAAFQQQLRDLNLPGVLEVRGLGLMIGVDLDPKVVAVGDVIDALAKRRFLALKAGDNTLRLLPPVIASDDDFARAAEHIAAVLRG
jgi:acetylornithine/LysW-gamma-L-lysine aminotransferase